MMTFRKKFLCLLVVFVLFFAPGSAGGAGREKAFVTGVVDGDTLRVSFDGGRASVRLIGIDTPETRPNKKAHQDSQRTHTELGVLLNQGMAAKRFVMDLMPSGKVIELEFDVQRRDRYGRTLAYVYTADGRMLNERIVAEGYAVPMTIPPNVRYAELFRQAHEQAREAKRGLWSHEWDKRLTPPE